MALSSVRNRFSGKLPMVALLLALGIVFGFSMAITVPAVAQDSDIKGVLTTNGWWSYLPDGSIGGKTHGLLRANFSGNASGGQVFVSFENGDWFLVSAEPESVVILDGDWDVIPSQYNVGGEVSGYTAWAIGPVVDTNNAALYEDTWALLGAYDGGESADNMDYLLAYAGLDESTARFFHTELLGGTQLIPLVVFLNKGNAILKVHISED